MTQAGQRRLALAGAVTVIAVLLAANLHLVLVAVGSQPDCVAVTGAPLPARHSC
mgnify:CR=1 FL=1